MWLTGNVVDVGEVVDGGTVVDVVVDVVDRDGGDEVVDIVDGDGSIPWRRG